jgi:hypothetical protein
MPTFVVQFDIAEEITPSPIKGRVFDFPFTVVDRQYLGTPHQSAHTQVGRITVEISATQLALWKLSDANLRKALFQVAIDHLHAETKRTTQLAGNMKVRVKNYPYGCPFDLQLIDEPSGAVLQLEFTRPIGFV